jgi:S-adenosylmethionine:tRNA ribosyltransferase-isomerase
VKADTFDETDFLLGGYRYELPPERIAQFPPEQRGDSRLLVMPRAGDLALAHRRFEDLPDCLPKNALLVANNVRVLPARLIGSRTTGGKVEFLLLTPLPLLTRQAKSARRAGDDVFTAEAHGLLRVGGAVNDGEQIVFGAGINLTVLETGSFGERRVRLTWQGNLARAFAATGHIPLPPYIKRSDDEEDAARYQTVYANDGKIGAAAAPTAGLHFTRAMRENLVRQGFEWVEITLYVGYGTFSPVRHDDIRHHRMHKEYIEISEAAAGAVNRAKAGRRPVLAIGTTSARALEGVDELCGRVLPYSGWIDIFLYSGRKFRVTDALLTNFHLPESSLLMLVAAFAGRERVLRAYAEAVRNGYRFFSYGDAMLIA